MSKKNNGNGSAHHADGVSPGTTISEGIGNANVKLKECRPGKLHQVGLGPSPTTLKPTNSLTKRPNPSLADPYKGGWHKNHGGIKGLGLESNHTPPKKVMEGLGFVNENGSKWSAGNASAVVLDYEDHRALTTTGSGAYKTYLSKLTDALTGKKDGEDTGRKYPDTMADALVLEINDLRSKLAAHYTKMQAEPGASNPHGTPGKDFHKYDQAYKDMITTCYPSLKGHVKLVEELGPF